ncbi:restriction endonuclease subunit S [Streptomyces sp. NPDC099050]|uniref:restriction endonuclease subunit S n=1 Tax=Streptomyces sp. NPDC099050 TaxID=3366100 RepID=UPI00381154AD
MREVQLGDVVSRVATRNSVGNENVLTISAVHGLVNQREFFNRRIASADVSQYYLLERGDFAYNKSYSDGWPVGVVRQLERYESGVVSPLYICFRPHREKVSPEFLQHYFDSGVLDDAIRDIAKEGVRNHGLLNVRVPDFFSLKMILPSPEEQRNIAEILDEVDEQLAGLRSVRAKAAHWLQGVRRRLISEQGDGELVEIGRLGQVVTGRTPDAGPRLGQGDGVPFVTPSEIVDGESVLDSAREARRGDFNVVEIPSGSTLVVCIGFGTGKVGLLGHSACVNQQINAVIPGEGVDPHFLFHAICEASAKIKVASSLQVTPIVNKSTFSQIQVMAPPSLPRQQEISRVLLQASLYLDQVDANIEKVKHLKRALMDGLLAGTG